MCNILIPGQTYVILNQNDEIFISNYEIKSQYYQMVNHIYNVVRQNDETVSQKNIK